MSNPVIQPSFHSGEWAPTLYGRVDLQKFHAALALARNWFVDYRGGVSTRAGSRYVLQAYKSAKPVRLIPFQASFTVNYVLEFGDFYLRFYVNGGPVLETGIAITAATRGANCLVTVPGHNYSNGDWIFISGVVGMTQLNGNYYSVLNVAGNNLTIGDLNGVAVNSTSYGTYVSGGTTQRVYTLSTPYAAADLALLKFAQNVNLLILTHPSYVPYVLTLVSAANWTLNAIQFGPTITAPAAPTVTTTLAAGTVNYAYIVTAVDSNGQESAPSPFGTLGSKQDLRTTAGTNSISWTAVNGASSYNVYKAELSYAGALPAGTQLGLIGNCSGTSFVDSNIPSDFSQTPPIVENPFQGAGVQSLTVTNQGGNIGGSTAIPLVTIDPPGAGGIQATAQAVVQCTSTTIASGGTGYTVGDTITGFTTTGTVFRVASVGVFNSITSLTIVNAGSVIGTTPMNPSGAVVGGTGSGATINRFWKITSLLLTSPGTGYTSVPNVTFSSGTAAATAILGTASSGNPSVPAYFQQRLVLGGPTNSPQQFNMSQPGSPYNFNISNPVQDDDAITGTLSSTRLNTLKAMLPIQSGLLSMTDTSAWIINGGGQNQAITPPDATAQIQSYVGACDVPPVVCNNDVLYVQSKNSIVRDLTYNFYTNIYTGADISVLSSHLFYGYQILEWAYAEEPFKIVWAVRNDGVMLSLTFMKEQEIVGWCHHDTNGLYKSVCAITEQVSFGFIDAIYYVVQRTINGNTVQYIERMAERIFPNGAKDAWCVDAGIQYNGAPTTTFTGAQHLAGATVTGLADGVAITPFAMPISGNFTLPLAASKVTVGLAFLPQAGTLPLDLGEPTVQSKRKKITGLTVRVNETLGLWCGRNLNTQVAMKDLVVGNVGTMSNQIVTDLVSSDARTIVDPQWDAFGAYFITQPNPMPATILAVIPEIEVGDSK